MNTLALLILEHLQKAQGNMIPDGTLFIELKGMTRPASTQLDWKKAITFLTKKGLIGTDRDAITEEQKHYIEEAGTLFLRRRNK